MHIITLQRAITATGLGAFLVTGLAHADDAIDPCWDIECPTTTSNTHHHSTAIVPIRFTGFFAPSTHSSTSSSSSGG